MSTQTERSATTRSKILAVARVAFVHEGYDGASLEKIAAEARLTKGALYHHYAGKEALFAAVFTLVTQEVIEAIGRRTAKTVSARKHLKESAITWLQAIEASDARAIILDLGPKALGFAQARALEDTIALEPLLRLVQAVINEERLKDGVDALLVAHLFNATLTEIALLRHATGGKTPTIEMAKKSIAGVIDGLLKNV
jgi:AcrR family transcriptional regulator